MTKAEIYVEKYLKILKPYNDDFVRLSKIFIFASTLVTFFLIIFFCDRGFDVTDDAYYLLRIINFNDEISNLSSFGKYLKFLNINNTVYAIRLLGVLILLLTSLILSFAYYKLLQINLEFNLRKSDFLIFTVFLLLCTSSYYSQHFLLTPSYNWLSLLGAMISLSSIAMLFSLINHLISKMLSLLAMSFGTILMYAGKPPGAIIIAICLVCALLMFFDFKKSKNYIILYLVFCILFLISHTLVMENGFSEYLSGIKRGLIIEKALGGGHTIFDIIYSALKDIIKLLDPFKFIKYNFVFILGYIYSLRLKKCAGNKEVVFMFFMLLNLLTSSLIYNSNLVRVLYGQIFILFLVFTFRKDLSSSSLQKDGKLFFSIILYLLIIAAATKFGTNNKFIESTFGAFGIYGLIAFFIALIIDSKRRTFFCLYLCIWSLALNVSFARKVASPYRLAGSMFEQSIKVNILNNNDHLFVDKVSADWIHNLRNMAKSGGWSSGNYLLDLTGGTPGAVILLNGHAPGVTWLLGGYPGSDQFLIESLKLVNCTALSKSWVLTTEDGSRRISPILLNKFNLKFPDNYKKLGSLNFQGHRVESQVLWKPNDFDSCKQ